MNTTKRSSNVLLFVVCLAQFMVILDVSIVNVALPSIHTGLHFSTTGLQWVVNAYTLTFAGFLLLGGRAADLLGRRLVFITGTAAFAVCSLVCALASSRGLLLGARALQGLAGALLSPATLSIITSTFREGVERNRGLGIWGAMGGLGASSGALLGGILTQSFSWPAIFAVNVPLGAIVIALGMRVIPKGAARDVESERHFDVTGAVLVTAGLALATFGIVRTDTLGWGSAGVLIPLAAAAALLAAFVYVEERVAARPLMPLSIFRLRQLTAANLVVVLLYMGLFASFFFVTLYLQQTLHYSALDAGFAFLPWTLSVFGGSTLAPRLVARFGLRTVLAGGMLLATLGLAYFTGVKPGGSYVAQVLPGAIPAGLGMGLALVTGTVAAVQGVPGEQSGLASGLLNTSRLVGGALGLAILSTVAAGQSRGLTGAGAVTNGFSLAFWVGAGFTLAGAVAALTLLAPGRSLAAVDSPPADREVEALAA
ncbi:MAG TPA: MFS transporter [Solirubrobacteraceae bacterium]|nr:MFS transporter [Solirubrobacteraceae bacterium]